MFNCCSMLHTYSKNVKKNVPCYDCYIPIEKMFKKYKNIKNVEFCIFITLG